MARPRKKKRTQLPVPTTKKPGTGTRDGRSPKSMVIRIGAGEVGPSVSQLVQDVRRMMEPGTASRLKERKANKLRDYTTMTGPLGVTHLLLFSRSESGNTNLRLALTPRGPTLYFRVERYALCKDVRRSLKHPKANESLYQTPPLLVMNNFLTNLDEEANKALKNLESLTTTVFQGLFPAIAPQKTPLSDIRRVLLLDRSVPPTLSGANPLEPSKPDTDSGPNTGTYIINLRHYAIASAPTDLSRPIRKLRAAERLNASKNPGKGVPDLGRLQDVSDFLLDPAVSGFTSGSDSEADTDAEVEVLAPQTTRVLSRRKWEQERRRRVASAEGQSNGTGAKLEDSTEKSITRDDANEGKELGLDNADETNEENTETSSSQAAGVKAKKVVGTGGAERRAIRLTEIGPRLKLRLTKVEEGVCAGKVLWHEFVTKTRAEEKALESRWAEKRRLKEERKHEQKENVERKKALKGDGNDGGADADADDQMDEHDGSGDAWEDEEWDSDEMEE